MFYSKVNMNKLFEIGDKLFEGFDTVANAYWKYVKTDIGWDYFLDLPGLGPEDVEVSEINSLIEVKVKKNDSGYQSASLSLHDGLELKEASMKNGRLKLSFGVKKTKDKNIIPVRAG